jgi:hypothetical protein
MANRRPLAEGLTDVMTVDPVKEEEFVYGVKARPPQTAAPAAIATNIVRTPLSTRIRTDFFEAMKRASLERQLNGQGTNTLIEILEEAMEPWLKTHGYLN